jgi:hypothetical protein
MRPEYSMIGVHIRMGRDTKEVYKQRKGNMRIQQKPDTCQQRREALDEIHPVHAWILGLESSEL